MENQILKQQASSYNTYLKIKDNPRFTKIWKYLEDNTKPDFKLLDIGCTNGDFSAPLIEKGYDCHGLEFMEDAIKESENRGLKVTNGSFLESFPYEAESFDIVFGGEVIEHTTDDSFFLSETNKVLKNGGLLIITTPNLVSLGNRFLMLFGRLPRFAYAEFHYRMYNRALIEKKITEAGFEVVQFRANYVLVSRFFNKFLGRMGESLADYIPTFGENFIVIAKKVR